MKKKFYLECSAANVVYLYKVVTHYADGVVTMTLFDSFNSACKYVQNRLAFLNTPYVISDIVSNEYIIYHLKDRKNIEFIAIDKTVLHGNY